MKKKKVFTLLLIGFLIASCTKPIYKETVLKKRRILEASAVDIARSSANLGEYMVKIHNFEVKKLKEGVHSLTLRPFDSGFFTRTEHSLFRIFCKTKNGKLIPNSYSASNIWLCLKDGKIKYAAAVAQTEFNPEYKYMKTKYTIYYLEGRAIKEIPNLIKKHKLMWVDYVKLFETKETGLKGLIIITEGARGVDIYLRNTSNFPINVCTTSDYIVVTHGGKQYRFNIHNYYPEFRVLNPEERTRFYVVASFNRMKLQDDLQAIGILNYSIPPVPCTNGKGLLFFFKKEGWVVHNRETGAVLEKLMEEGLYNLPGPFIGIAPKPW